MFGVFSHAISDPRLPIFRGFDDIFFCPHSRHTGIRREDVAARSELEILADSPEAGMCIIQAWSARQFFITGHLEYDADTLSKEYFRDRDKGLEIEVPRNYFPGDNPNLPPVVNWRAHANLFFANWLNFYVYQETPYELEAIGANGRGLRA